MKKLLLPGTCSYTDGILQEGDTLLVQLTHTGANAVKDAGVYENTIESYQVLNRSQEDVTANYSFAEPVIGKLTIEKREITLTSGTDAKFWTQTGDYAYNDSVSVGGEGLVAGEELAYSGFQTLTTITYVAVDNSFTYGPASGSAFKESNYSVKQVFGKLALVDEIYVFAEDISVVYDGMPHMATVLVVDSGQGASVNLVYSTSQDGENWTEYEAGAPALLKVGTLYIRVKAKKGLQEKDAAFTLTIEQRPITLSSGSATKLFDTQPLTEATAALTDGTLASGDSITLSATGSQTAVGSSDNTISYTITGRGENVTSCYKVTEQLGTLTVTSVDPPATGDSFSMGLWLSLLAAAALGMTALAKGFAKRKY